MKSIFEKRNYILYYNKDGVSHPLSLDNWNTFTVRKRFLENSYNEVFIVENISNIDFKKFTLSKTNSYLYQKSNIQINYNKIRSRWSKNYKDYTTIVENLHWKKLSQEWTITDLSNIKRVNLGNNIIEYRTATINFGPEKVVKDK